MLQASNSIAELSGVDPNSLTDAILRSTRPVVLRGLVSRWPMVHAAKDSAKAASNYLRELYRGIPVEAFLAEPKIQGRFFYNDDFSGFNFQTERLNLDAVLDDIERYQNDVEPPTI